MIILCTSQMFQNNYVQFISAGSGFLNVRICWFSLTLMIVNEDTLDLWLSVDFDILQTDQLKK